MNIADLKQGTSLSSNGWFEISQDLINQFADATGDHQWIHLDAERCATQSPFKTTVAHGFLTAALMPKMFAQSVEIDPVKYTMLNYGIDNLRYLEPVRVNDSIRFSFILSNIEEKATGALHRFKTTVEIQGRDKPALVGEFLMLLLNKA